MRFLRLPAEKRSLLIQSAFWLMVYGIALRWFPSRTLRRALRHDSMINSGRFDRVSLVTWSVGLAAQYVPGNTCLTRALVAHRLLGRAGAGSQVQIGVARIDGEFQAHAWVECDGRVVIGKTRDLKHFVPLQENQLAIAQCVA